MFVSSPALAKVAPWRPSVSRCQRGPRAAPPRPMPSPVAVRTGFHASRDTHRARASPRAMITAERCKLWQRLHADAPRGGRSARPSEASRVSKNRGRPSRPIPHARGRHHAETGAQAEAARAPDPEPPSKPERVPKAFRARMRLTRDDHAASCLRGIRKVPRCTSGCRSVSRCCRLNTRSSRTKRGEPARDAHEPKRAVLSPDTRVRIRRAAPQTLYRTAMEPSEQPRDPERQARDAHREAAIEARLHRVLGAAAQRVARETDRLQTWGSFCAPHETDVPWSYEDELRVRCDVSDGKEESGHDGCESESLDDDEKVPTKRKRPRHAWMNSPSSEIGSSRTKMRRCESESAPGETLAEDHSRGSSATPTRRPTPSSRSSASQASSASHDDSASSDGSDTSSFRRRERLPKPQDTELSLGHPQQTTKDGARNAPVLSSPPGEAAQDHDRNASPDASARDHG